MTTTRAAGAGMGHRLFKRRRYSCARGRPAGSNQIWRSQTEFAFPKCPNSRSGEARHAKGVISAEPGFAQENEEGETALEARRGDTLFSRRGFQSQAFSTTLIGHCQAITRFESSPAL